jgi:hypothetical protein
LTREETIVVDATQKHVIDDWMGFQIFHRVRNLREIIEKRALLMN